MQLHVGARAQAYIHAALIVAQAVVGLFIHDAAVKGQIMGGLALAQGVVGAGLQDKSRPPER